MKAADSFKDQHPCQWALNMFGKAECPGRAELKGIFSKYLSSSSNEAIDSNTTSLESFVLTRNVLSDQGQVLQSRPLISVLSCCSPV